MFIVPSSRTMKNAKPVVDDGKLFPEKGHSVQWMKAHGLQPARVEPRKKPVVKQKPMVLMRRHGPFFPRPLKTERTRKADRIWADFREWLATNPQPTRRTVEEIIFEASERYRMPVRMIKSPCRHVDLVAMRHTTIAIAYVERPELSLVQLGKQFGGRDHTTVLHSVKKAGVWRNPGAMQQRAASECCAAPFAFMATKRG